MRRDISAGLALRGDGLRYVEAEAGGKVLRQAAIPLPEGCVVRGSIQRPGDLESAFRSLKEQAGRFPCPVVLGLPAGNVHFKVIDYPRMPLSDARDALSLEFERHFPYSWDKAAADIMELETPGTSSRMSLLAAAARKSLVDRLLRSARRAKIPVGAVEPENVAFFRAVMGRGAEGLYLVLGSGGEMLNIIVGYRDNGVLFRSVPQGAPAEQSILQEVQNTIAFTRTRYPEEPITRLFLTGSLTKNERLKAMLSPLDVRDAGPAEESFAAALGLTLKGRMKFDLRPADYLERERRRRSLSPLRAAALLLIALFPASCAFYAVASLRRAHALGLETAALQGAVARLEDEQAALMSELSRLKGREARLSRTFALLQDDPPVLEALNALEACFPEGVRALEIRFGAGRRAVVEATAAAGDQVLALVEALRQSGSFRSVTLPGSQRDEASGRVRFSLNLGLSEPEELLP